MVHDVELNGRELLRDTPEGELWTSVLADGLEGLRQALDWLGETYEARRARIERDLEAGTLKPARYRERIRELERDRREREDQISSSRWFFFNPDSPLEFICDVLDYPTALIREHARRLLEQAGETANRGTNGRAA